MARLRTLALAGKAAGREVVVLGRAMNTMLRTAHAAEVLEGFPATLDPLDAENVPRRNLLVLATGSQGERRAATAQLAQGKFLGFELRAGDTFLFSSKTIPGNEVAVARILNQLSEKGVTVIDDSGRALPRLGPRQPAGSSSRCRSWCGRGCSCRCTASTGTLRRWRRSGASGGSPRRWRRTGRWWT